MLRTGRLLAVGIGITILLVGVAAAGEYTFDPMGEDALWAELNAERSAALRDPLERDPQLDDLARMKAADMAQNRYFDHVSPTLGTVYDMLDAADRSYQFAGENIARVGTMQQAHPAFMDSPDHQANIVSAGYSRGGIGVVHYQGKVYVAQIFLHPR